MSTNVYWGSFQLCFLSTILKSFICNSVCGCGCVGVGVYVWVWMCGCVGVCGGEVQTMYRPNAMIGKCG